jgi:triacylglycerol esterase/lipase EstA (alpha/beta hydrolase family)
MIDSLRNDPWIREHYQFWFYSYPSGYPYPYSAALFRHDLDGIDRAFPNHKRVMLIGHSMGGMICRLMITDAGDKIWRDFFSTPPAKTPLASDTRKLLEESLVFNHRPDVQRVIFISTPHRGSKLASGWIGRIGAASGQNSAAVHFSLHFDQTAFSLRSGCANAEAHAEQRRYA